MITFICLWRMHSRSRYRARDATLEKMDFVTSILVQNQTVGFGTNRGFFDSKFTSNLPIACDFCAYIDRRKAPRRLIVICSERLRVIPVMECPDFFPLGEPQARLSFHFCDFK